ncbi:hypothetical protein ED312_05735 [Sinomicrobium pectinilyticum]|uniref:Uncharacterized protein n=2 Tax=Sinomicrobium pectinilyticum TaxID=1084421 RepID=A0A3N0ESC6_SINP1|nr:hypothetical protein ED312_05735 [Sinomicrobium pectinilyticum]
MYCLLAALVVIGGLFWVSRKDNSKTYDFSRTFTESPLVIKNRKVLKLRNEFHYIAGLTEKNIFLGDKAYSGKLFTTDYNLNNGQYKDLNVPDSTRIAWKAVKIFVNYPDVFLIEGITPTILRGSYSNPGQYNTYTQDNQPFHHPLPLSKNSFLARVYDTNTNSFILTKGLLDPISSLDSKYVLEQQNKNIFSSDGMLTYDPVTQKVVYTHFYHNELICFDTDLNPIYKGNTIDPISKAQLKMDTIQSENKMTLSAPPLYVNKQNNAYNGKLYVRSALVASNENKQAFKHNTVIDVYTLNNTEIAYQNSFYILSYKNEKLREFKVFNNHIISLQGNYLVIDQFNVKP